MTMPLSRQISAAAVPAHGLAVEVVADEAERAALAAENDVESIERLIARLEVRPAGKDGLTVRGTLEALTTRLCVVTLEPFVEAVDEEIDVRFAPEDVAAAAAEDPDGPDPIVNGFIDLGAVAAEFFTLGLDPYPRKPGAALDPSIAGDDDAASPFAALRGLKPRDGETD